MLNDGTVPSLACPYLRYAYGKPRGSVTRGLAVSRHRYDHEPTSHEASKKRPSGSGLVASKQATRRAVTRHGVRGGTGRQQDGLQAFAHLFACCAGARLRGGFAVGAQRIAHARTWQPAGRRLIRSSIRACACAAERVLVGQRPAASSATLAIGVVHGALALRCSFARVACRAADGLILEEENDLGWAGAWR